MSEEKQYIDILKGYRRLGKFPLDAGSVFATLAEAQQYVDEGNMNGTAYEGQILTVFNPMQNLDPDAYIVMKVVSGTNASLQLTKLTGALSDKGSLSYAFDHNTISNQTVIAIPAGYTISTISVSITEAFSEPTGLYGAGFYYVDDLGNTVWLVRETVSTDETEDDILFEEIGEYVFKKTITAPTTAPILIKMYNNLIGTTGKGTIKAN